MKQDQQCVDKMLLLLATVYESARLLPAGPLLQRCSLKHGKNMELYIAGYLHLSLAYAYLHVGMHRAYIGHPTSKLLFSIIQDGVYIRICIYSYYSIST